MEIKALQQDNSFKKKSTKNEENMNIQKKQEVYHYLSYTYSFKY